MRYQILSVVIVLVVGCGSTQGTGPAVTGPDVTRQEVVLVTSSGQTINMDGGWQAVCVAQGSVFLSEEFTFSGPTLRINIQAYGTSDCQGTPLDTETVTLSFTPRGSSLPGSRNWSETGVPTSWGDSVSTKIPPSLMFRANSENSSSTVR